MRLISLLIIGLGGTAVLVALAVWQVQRLAWKEGVLAEIESKIGGAPLTLAELDAVDDREWRAVALTGAYAGDEVHVLTATDTFGPSYRVIAGFDTEDGRRVMVDRGIIRDSAKDAARQVGPAELVTNYRTPDEVDRWTPPYDATRDEYYARDVAPMAAALDAEPMLFILRSQEPAVDTPLATPVDTSTIPNNHRNYAITWSLLALVWAVMSVYLALKSRKPDPGAA